MINDGYYPYNPQQRVRDFTFHHVVEGAEPIAFSLHNTTESGGRDQFAGAPEAEKPPEIKAHPADFRVRAIVAFIDSNYQAQLSIADLTRRVNLSRSRLDVLFKNEIGMSPLQYLKLTRFRRAKELFQSEPTLTVKEVMAAVGIDNKSHFGREFKRIFGLSPSQYRIQCGLERFNDAG